MSELQRWHLQFSGRDIVQVLEDGNPVASGHGQGRDGALLDAWIALLDLGRRDVAKWVSDIYRSHPKVEPKRSSRGTNAEGSCVLILKADRRKNATNTVESRQGDMRGLERRTQRHGDL